MVREVYFEGDPRALYADGEAVDPAAEDSVLTRILPHDM